MAQTPPIASQMPQAPIKGSEAQHVVPFRIATLERTEILPSESGLITTGQQPIERTMEGTGFLYDVVLDMSAVAAGNGAVVAFNEDAPWSALGQVILSDPTGQIVNLSGYNLFLANLVMRNYANRNIEASTTLFNAGTAGAVATGGSFSLMVSVPAGINRRSLLGILGNQDRSVKYQLRTDIGASGSIYSTPPTTLPPYTLQKLYDSYAVPPAVGPAGPQQIIPDGFGTLSFTTSTISESAPLGGSQVNHYLRRIGNTIRYIILVFRSNGSRATAEANAPTSIQFKFGDTTVFNETYRKRRYEMFMRYGFDFPNGVLVYDMIHDFLPFAGGELGDDWLNSQNINTAQFLIQYPGGFGSTANSLNVITGDLALVGQPLGS